MNMGKVLLLCAAALGAMFLICGAAIWFDRKFPGKSYDERQNICRGNAYAVAFWVGAAYFFAYVCWTFPNGKARSIELDPFLVVYIGLLIQVMVLHVYCLLTRSALPVSGSWVLTMISYGVMGTSSLMNFYFGLNNPYVADSMHVVGLVNAVSFYSLAVMHLISGLWKAREDHE